jgi:hypothetical protein
MRQLFDERRTAKWRRTRRRAWITLAVGVTLRIAVQYLATRLGGNAPVLPAWIIAMILLDIVNTVSFVVGVGASPRSERRALRFAARISRTWFASMFFRVAAIGRGRSTSARSKDRAALELRLEDLAPANVLARYPDLRDTLRTVERARADLRVREAEITQALADAGGARPSVAAGSEVSHVTSGGAPGENGRASEHTLRDRRDALLGEMRDALETTRSRRTTMTAALENVRIQLLRIGAGIGSPDDLQPEIATLRSLVAD